MHMANNFLLFTAPDDWERKSFVASFESREAAVAIAEKLKGKSPMRWQVIDCATAACVAQNRGGPAGRALS